MNNNLERELQKVQNDLRSKIKLNNTFSSEEVVLVAGVDFAYWTEDNTDYAVCCIQVLDYQTKQVIDKAEYTGIVEFPYISGYLAFRELPFVLKAVERLESIPDVYMFDGNGYLHSRHMGIATQASFELGKPTVGVAKTYLKINNVDFTMPENKVGAFEDIVIEDEVYGRVLRSRLDVKPIFISCGNWIDLDTATNLTMHFVEQDSRLPVTTRFADLATHEVKRRYQNK